jgi:flavodoxin
MGKTLVAYFSATRTTERVASKIAQAANAELFEIEPVQHYIAADLNWNDRSSRSSIEMNDDACRPAIAASVDDMARYDTVFVGFPVWWYVEPRIIDTFLEAYDFVGKTIVPFATSGGSGLGQAPERMQRLAAGATVLPGCRLSSAASQAEIDSWVASLGL